LQWVDTLIPVFQPAHSPELNPIERLWQYLKQRFKGENFATLELLRERLRQEFSMLSAQRVASLTSDDFVLEALFYAAF
jgi:transposase